MLKLKKTTKVKKIVKKRKPSVEVKPKIKTKLSVGGVKKVEKKVKAKVVKKLKKPVIKKVARYFEAIGRRKTSVARVRIFTQGKKEILINEKPYEDYFPTSELQNIVTSALEKMKALDKFRTTCKVKGGGIHSQAEAVRHGIAQTLVKFNLDFRKRLKKVGYLTRDSRIRERKKFGLKRARRAPQWKKR